MERRARARADEFVRLSRSTARRLREGYKSITSNAQ
jgi:hypothetical protein